MLNEFVSTVTDTVASGEPVVLTGFAKFVRVERGPRIARNPQTGAPVKVPAKKAARITPLKAFKDAVVAGKPVKKAAAKKAAPAKKAVAKKAARQEGRSRQEGRGEEGPRQEGAGQEGAGQEGHRPPLIGLVLLPAGRVRTAPVPAGVAVRGRTDRRSAQMMSRLTNVG